MVSAPDCRASAQGLSPGWGHCVVFLAKTLNSQGGSLHPGVLLLGDSLAMDYHPFERGVKILLNASCY